MYTHSGKLRGYAFVYEANGAGDYQMSDSTFPVYENEDGTFSIEYNGEIYVGVRVSKRYGNKTEYLRAKEVLDDLGIEIPQKLTDAINGVM